MTGTIADFLNRQPTRRDLGGKSLLEWVDAYMPATWKFGCGSDLPLSLIATHQDEATFRKRAGVRLQNRTAVHNTSRDKLLTGYPQVDRWLCVWANGDGIFNLLQKPVSLPTNSIKVASSCLAFARPMACVEKLGPAVWNDQFQNCMMESERLRSELVGIGFSHTDELWWRCWY